MKSHSQEIVAKEGSFGLDENKKIIVWHQTNIDSLLLTKGKINSFKFGKKFVVVDTAKSLSYTMPLTLSFRDDLYLLYVTKLPLIHLSTQKAINDNSKSLGVFTYFNEGRYVENVMGIEHRGNLSLSFPKKSYDLEFWMDSTSKKKKNVKFKGLRSDDDWILDGLYNEPLRIRSTLAAKLWLEIHKPNYLQSEPKAKSGFDVTYVEVFKNNDYIGLYSLSEGVDRKLLALKKNDKQTISGELFKAFSYEGAPAFKKAPTYNNLFPHWGGFEMKFPLVESKAHWEDISQLVNLVVHGSDDEFASKIGGHVNVVNAIDYFLFVNLLRATDNLGKNYYLAKYDEGNPYFFVPWDLDGVVGIIKEGKRISTTDDILSNGLFDRLLKVDPNDYRNRLKQRWGKLRKDHLAEQKLLLSLEKVYSRMKTEKIYEREHLIWLSEFTTQENYEYLKSWLKNRLVYLDEYFDGL